MEKKNNKSETILSSLIVLAMICVIAFLFWPNSNARKGQSNDIDESKLQIKITVKRINVREKPSTDSKDIGDVYYDEIYTVLDSVTTDEYYWYKIKTNNDIEGYIASDVNAEYVKVVSGYIDRTPPVLKLNKGKYVFANGIVSYDDVQCIDEYSECVLRYEKNDSNYITFYGTDIDGNETSKRVEYYDVYDMNNNYKDETNNFEINYVKRNKDKYIVIDSIYTLKNGLYGNNISDSYSSIINLYDENFDEIHDIAIGINEYNDLSSCINDAEIVLKNEYLSGIGSGKKLCISYSFINDEKVKYVAFGFNSDNNFDNPNNFLANYYSKYFTF